jgi:DNA-binding SARP family transcriptional activator
MAGTCTIHLLGGFRVEVRGRAVAAEGWRHRRGADLVKLLALSPGHRLHREQVMAALWPDLGPDAASANLRKATHFARRAFGSEDAIGVDAGMISLWPAGQVAVDVELFESAAREASSRDEFADAASLYVGELLPEDRYAPWTESQRDRLRLRYMEVLRAAELWDQVLGLDPADEEAHRALIRTYHEAGNRHAAIRQFERLRDVLRVDLGVGPDRDSVALYEKVLAMEGHEPPTAAQRAQALLAWGLVHWNQQDFDEAERTAREARSLSLDAGLGKQLGEASALLGLVASARGRWRDVFRSEFVASMERGPELAGPVFDAHLCLADYSLYAPDWFEHAEAFARELQTIAEEAGSVHGMALTSMMLGEAELLSGRLDRSHEDLSDAVRLHGKAAAISGESLSLSRLAEVAIAQGKRLQANRLLAKALRLADRSPLVSHLRIRAVGVLVQAAADDDRAMGVVEQAEASWSPHETCEPCSMAFRVTAAGAAARSGDHARARLHLEHAERIAGMWQGGPWLAAVWEARGTLRLAEGDRSQAAALFREAAEQFGQMRRPIDEERCRVAAAAAS